MPLSALEQHRQHFPALQNKTYFNFGGQGPMPQQAIAAILRAHEYSQSRGPFSNEVNAWMTKEMHLTRQAIANELQVEPGTITLTEDVTVGCNIPLWGLDWREGDHILMTDCEHPGVIAAVVELQRRFGLAVSTCPIQSTLNEGDPAAVVRQHLRPTTRLLIISHILWNTGQVLPLRDIVAVCREFPAQLPPVRVLVDAAQSAGVLPLNLTELGADFYAFTGHKWMCGPAGMGALYVHPEALASIQPTFIGWRGIARDEQSQQLGWQPDGRRFEVATSDFALYGALREAIALHHAWGTAEQRYQRICDLSRSLWERLRALPPITCLRIAPPAAGLVSFTVDGGHHAQFVQSLEHQGFLLRTLADPDCIRAGVHYLTLESEIDRLVDAIQNLLKSA